jgi:hypothetical protein
LRGCQMVTRIEVDADSIIATSFSFASTSSCHASNKHYKACWHASLITDYHGVTGEARKSAGRQ